VLLLLVIHGFVLSLQLFCVSLLGLICLLEQLELLTTFGFLQSPEFGPQVLDLLEVLIMLLVMILRIDRGFLGKLLQFGMEIVTLVLGGCQVSLIVVGVLSNVFDNIDLVIQCSERGLHPLDLSIPLSQFKRKILIFLLDYLYRFVEATTFSWGRASR